MDNADKRISVALNKGEEYWTFKEDAERDYVHNLFAYPAMMVPKMQREILQTIKRYSDLTGDLTLYDPFMGSGTTLVEGMLQGFNVIGVDINPLAYLVAKVKTEIYSLARLKKSIERIIEAICPDCFVEIPTQFAGIENWFKPNVIKELDIIKQEIRKESCKKIRRFLWVVFSDTVRVVSNARSCTYKLYKKTERSIDNFDKSPIEVFITLLENAYTSVESFQNELRNRNLIVNTGKTEKYSGFVEIRLANTLMISESLCKKYKPSIVITSPPYGDNETTVTYGQYSVLALRWIDLNDIDNSIDNSIIETQTKIDNISLGGKTSKTSCIGHKDIIAEKSSVLKKQLADVETADENKVWKVISFYYDFDRFANTLCHLSKDAYIVMTLGNRTVAKQKIKMNEIVRQLFENYDFEFVTEFSRRIINKRMSIINAIDENTGALLESMTSEYVLILKKR